jgi:four helix bundle protein
MDLVVLTYRLTRQFPVEERFALSLQARRAAVSIPANLAEGQGRIHRGEYHRHVGVARGSLRELDTHLEIALRLGYVSETDLALAAEQIDHVGRMLTNLGASLRSV